MKNIKYTLILLVILVLSISSCKKDSPVNADVKITVANSGKVTALKKGQTIALTLGNPGDGGYQFNAPKYEAAFLRLNGHVHTDPPKSNIDGDFGTDTWNFTSLKTGTTTLEVTAVRPFDTTSTVTMFSGTISVK